MAGWKIMRWMVSTPPLQKLSQLHEILQPRRGTCSAFNRQHWNSALTRILAISLTAA